MEGHIGGLEVHAWARAGRKSSAPNNINTIRPNTIPGHYSVHSMNEKASSTAYSSRWWAIADLVAAYVGGTLPL